MKNIQSVLLGIIILLLGFLVFRVELVINQVNKINNISMSTKSTLDTMQEQIFDELEIVFESILVNRSEIKEIQ